MTPVDPNSSELDARSTRRGTTYASNSNGELSKGGTNSYLVPQPNNTARLLLGGDVVDHIRRNGLNEGREKTGVDVDLLLKGAESLCTV